MGMSYEHGYSDEELLEPERLSVVISRCIYIYVYIDVDEDEDVDRGKRAQCDRDELDMGNRVCACEEACA